MAAIPQIKLTLPIQEGLLFDDPNDIEFMRKEVTPGLDPNIVYLAESIAKDHFYHMSSTLPEVVTAQITCSVEHGVVFNSCSDERLKNCFFENTRKAFAIPAEGKSMLSGTPVHLIEPTAQMKAAAPEGSFFVDAIALHLKANGLTGATTFNLELRPYYVVGTGKGLTTGNLRHPHLLQGILEKNFRPDAKVCIVGPGLLEYQDKSIPPSCPQFAEIFSLLPMAEYTILDNDTHAIDVLAGQFSKGYTFYDPVMFRAYTMPGSPECTQDRTFLSLFDRMKHTLGERALTPKAKEILANIGTVKPLMLHLQNKEQVKVQEFDINSSSFSEGKKFDVMVATMSICNAIQEEVLRNPLANHFEKLVKFLDALEDQGSLFMDTNVIDMLCSPGGLGLEGGKKYLEERLGRSLTFEIIPVSSFVKKVEGSRGTISLLSSHLLQGAEKQVMSVDTSSIIVITKGTKEALVE